MLTLFAHQETGQTSWTSSHCICGPGSNHSKKAKQYFDCTADHGLGGPTGEIHSYKTHHFSEIRKLIIEKITFRKINYRKKPLFGKLIQSKDLNKSEFDAIFPPHFRLYLVWRFGKATN